MCCNRIKAAHTEAHTLSNATPSAETLSSIPSSGETGSILALPGTSPTKTWDAELTALLLFMKSTSDKGERTESAQGHLNSCPASKFCSPY